MQNKDESSALVVRQTYDLQLREFEEGLLNFLNRLNLPTDKIFVSVRERGRVFQNIEDTLALVDDDIKQKSTYISKFIAATASGLFYAALNYLWDETISELRQRVAQYDLSYFYEIAVRNNDRRKNLNSAEDLIKVEDSELIYGAKEIGLISELGYKHLDYIRYMRNWTSAAHPNQNEITGIQLISWLETCIKEVISLPLSDIVVDIKRLLNNIKTNSISEDEAREIGVFFLKLTQEQVNNLASGLFGIYTRLETNSTTRQNIHRLLPLLWHRVDESTRQQFGVRYGKFVADNDQGQSRLARQFLNLVSASSYIPDGLRAAEIETALENLLTAHRGMDNFYNEPPFARQLKAIVGDEGDIPPQINKKYVLGVVEVFLTNGHGITRQADHIYRSLINLFDAKQAFIAVLSFSEGHISSKLQFDRCATKYQELREMMKIKVAATPAILEIIDEIDKFSGPLDKLKSVSRFRQKVENVKKILHVDISL